MQSQINIEQQLLAELAAGDRAATTRIYQQNYVVVNGWLIKNGCSPADVADLFQEGMVILFGKAQDEEFRLTCNISTYLLAVTKHLWYKKLQSQSKEPMRLEDGMEGDDDRQDISYEDDLNVHHEREVHYEQLDAALDQVGEPCRSLLKAYYHHDKNMQEIATDFGYTNPDNAKNQKYKCLARLRKIFYSMQVK